MRIMGSHLSPFVMRAVLAARMKGLDIPVEMPEGGLKTEDYLSLNPMGKMPTFVDGDFALPESGVIAEYLNDLLDGPALLPEGPEGRATARLLARVVDLYLLPAMAPLFRTQKDPADVATGLARLRDALGFLDALRPPHAEWLAGDEHSLADTAAMPIFVYLDLFEDAFGTMAIVEQFPGLAGWWARARDTEHGLRMEQEMAAAFATFQAGTA
jgi:glutathione S-transferase